MAKAKSLKPAKTRAKALSSVRGKKSFPSSPQPKSIARPADVSSKKGLSSNIARLYHEGFASGANGRKRAIAIAFSEAGMSRKGKKH